MIWWHLPSRILATLDQQILLLGLLATAATLRGAVSKLQDKQVIGMGEKDSKGGFGGRSEMEEAEGWGQEGGWREEAEGRGGARQRRKGGLGPRRKWGNLRLPSDDGRRHSRRHQTTRLQRTPVHSQRYLRIDDSQTLLCINCDYIVRTCYQSFLVSSQLLTEILHKGLCEERKDVCLLAPGRKLSDGRSGGKVGLRYLQAISRMTRSSVWRAMHTNSGSGLMCRYHL